MSCYEHLGTLFSSSYTLDQEIATRIGMAKSALAQVAAPILCNRRIPEPTRLRLFKALIESKLFFGLAAWAAPTARQIAKIEAALISMLRKLFRLKPEAQRILPPLRRLHCCSAMTFAPLVQDLLWIVFSMPKGFSSLVLKCYSKHSTRKRLCCRMQWDSRPCRLRNDC